MSAGAGASIQCLSGSDARKHQQLNNNNNSNSNSNKANMIQILGAGFPGPGSQDPPDLVCGKTFIHFQ